MCITITTKPLAASDQVIDPQLHECMCGVSFIKFIDEEIHLPVKLE